MRTASGPQDMVGADVAFHLRLLAAANNELLAPFGVIIEQSLASMFAYTMRHTAKPEHVLPLHTGVVRAIAQQSPEAARTAMTALLDDTDEIISLKGR